MNVKFAEIAGRTNAIAVAAYARSGTNIISGIEFAALGKHPHVLQY